MNKSDIILSSISEQLLDSTELLLSNDEHCLEQKYMEIANKNQYEL